MYLHVFLSLHKCVRDFIHARIIFRREVIAHFERDCRPRIVLASIPSTHLKDRSKKLGSLEIVPQFSTRILRVPIIGCNTRVKDTNKYFVAQFPIFHCFCMFLLKTEF